MADSACAIEIATVTSLPGLFFAQAKKLGERPFLWAKVDGVYRPHSWREVAERVTAAAHGLKAAGVKAGDRVMEIGTGWGGFALHAAGYYGCHVTTTTISPSQHAMACQRVAAAGLGNRITLLLQDYRDLNGQYDKLVSIEMIEAVGHQYYDTFFGKCKIGRAHV